MFEHRTRAGKNAVLALSLGLAFCLATAAQAATIWRVTTTGGNSSGADWTTNASSLQHALATAVSGDQVWVKAGTYLPTATADRTQTFALITGVSVYGGFAGTETNLLQRNWTNNVTVLSGDIGTVGNNSDNSYHVVTVTTGGTIDGFTISNGNATGAAVQNGGGIVNNSNFTVANCLIVNNTAPIEGGGIYSGGGTVAITGCTFQGNSAIAGGFGGGLFIQSGTVSINSSQFIANSSGSFGGGIANGSATATLNNCVFLDNTSASNGGGGIATGLGSTTTIFNSTFNANQANGGVGGAINMFGGTVTVTNSILWGDSPGELAGAATVTYSDVQSGFAGAGNINSNPLFVSASDLHLQNTSPCIDQGTGTGATAYDLDGNGRVDVPTIANSAGGAPNYVDMGAYENQGSFAGQKIYVNAACTSATQNGQSWATAFNNLQSALAVAGATSEIWVAAGTYTPTVDATLNPAPVDARTKTFSMKKGVAIRGGFLGTETAASQRPGGSGLTTLTGEIGAVGVTDNCYHVMTANNETDLSAILDSFTITAGYANGASPNDSGAGILVNGGSPNIVACLLFSNVATSNGGGFYVLNGAPALMLNCSYNEANQGGAGCVNGGSPTIQGVFQGNSSLSLANGGALAILAGSTVNIGNSQFSDNVSAPTMLGWGGGIYAINSTLAVSNCAFDSNSAWAGGGIFADFGASVTATACAFTNNSALTGGTGGAVFCNIGSTATLTNCVFSGNSSTTNGGGLASSSALPVSLVNCTFNANAATTNGGALFVNAGTPVLTNCILWGDSATTGPEINGAATATYSCVQGTLLPGTGNINTDPLFTSATDLQLHVGSPCVDTGTAAGAPATDILGVARPQGAGIDMGAYELPYNPITFSSAAGATPNPAGVGETISFSSDASGGWGTLTYTWDFNDNTAGATGASVTHAYAAAGSYSVTVTAADNRTHASSTVAVSVVAPIVGTGTDTTGDGYSDSFLTATGYVPSQPATAGAVQKLSVSSASIKLNFAKPVGNDSIGLSGVLLIQDGFSASGQKVYVDIGGVIESFTLGANGVSTPKGNNAFAVGVKATKGVVALQVAKFAVKLTKGSFAAALVPDGLVNATTSASVTVPVTVLFNGAILQKNLTMSYKAAIGKGGAAK